VGTALFEPIQGMERTLNSVVQMAAVPSGIETRRFQLRGQHVARS
jgi:hypothetical protein